MISKDKDWCYFIVLLLVVIGVITLLKHDWVDLTRKAESSTPNSVQVEIKSNNSMGSETKSNAVLAENTTVAENVLEIQFGKLKSADNTHLEQLPALDEGVNKSPIADAGKDIWLESARGIRIYPTLSYDDKYIAVYKWKQVSGSARIGAYEASDGELRLKAPVVLEEQKAVFRLTVTDEEGLTDSDTMTVIVVPQSGVENGLGHDLVGEEDLNYVKLDFLGFELPYDTTEWSCVKDKETGLVWESKSTKEGLHYIQDSYNWNSGPEGVVDDDGAICSGYDEKNPQTFCNSQAFISRVNDEFLCGSNTWRLPSVKELKSLYKEDDLTGERSINSIYFRGAELGASHWSDETYQNIQTIALGVRLKKVEGSSRWMMIDKDATLRLKLVYQE